MMRLLVLALCGICLADSSRRSYLTTPEESFLTPGYQYNYKYETQVMTGIPNVTQVVTGLKIKTTVLVQVESRSELTVKMENIRVLKVNTEAHCDPTEPIPETFCRPIESEQSRIFREELSKPVQIQMSNGMVTRLKTSPSDPYWSINIKRGLLNLFQQNLEQENKVQTRSSILRHLEAKLNTNTKLESAFTVMEEGVAGKCETVYAIVPPSERSVSGREMEILKTVDYKSCAVRPLWQPSLMSGKICAECMHDEKFRPTLIESVNHAKILATGNRRKFLVREVKMKEEHIFVPFQPEQGRIVSYVSQVLKLVNTQKTTSPVPSESRVSQRKALLFDFPHLETTSDTPSSSSSWMGYRETSEKNIDINEITPLLRTIAEEITEHKISKSVPEKLYRLTKVLRNANKEQLVTLVEKYESSSSKTDKKIKEILLDLVPSVATPEAMMCLRELIKKRQLTGMRATLAINTLCLTALPRVETAEQLMLLYTEPTIREEKTVRRAAILGAGALIHAIRKTLVRNKVPETDTILQNLNRKLETLYKEASTKEEKIVMLKSFGNAGLPDCIKTQDSVIKNRETPTSVRVQAIYSLRRTARVIPRMVQSIVLPLVMNPTEPTEVRIAAFLVLCECRPSVGVIQMLVHMVNKGTNVQVSSFVYTHIRTVAMTSRPCLKSFARAARVVMPLIRSIPMGIQYSKAMKFDTYSKWMKLGFAFDAYTINTGRSVLPRSYVASLKTLMFGYSTNWLEAGWEMKGMEPMIRRLLGPSGILSSMTSITDLTKILNTFTTGSSTKNRFMEDLMSKISMKRVLDEEPQAEAYVKIFGNEMAVIKLDKSTLESLFTTVLPKLISLERRLMEGTKIELLKTHVFTASHMLPTGCGLPVTLNLTSSLIFNLEGSIKATTEPSLSKSISKLRFPKEISAHVNLKPSLAWDLCGSLGVDATLVQAGTALRARTEVNDVKLDFVTKLNIPEDKFELKINVPKSLTPKIHIESHPYGFVHEVPSRVSHAIFITEKKSIVAPSSIARTYSIPMTMRDVLGLTFETEGRLVYPVIPSMPNWLLLGRQTLKTEMRPSSRTPERIVVDIKRVESDSSKYEPADSSSFSLFSWFHGSRSEEDEDERPYRRTSSKLFTPVSPPTSMSNAYKYKLLMQIKTEGSTPEKFVKMQVVTVTKPNRQLTHCDVQLVYCASESTVTSPWKLSFVSTTKYPNLPTSIRMPLSMEPVEAYMNLKWGRSSNPSKKITIKVTGSKGEEQMELERQLVFKPELLPEHRKCEEDKSRGLGEYSLACKSLTSKLLSLYKYRVELTHTEMPYWTRYTATKLYEMLKYRWYQYTYTKPEEETNPSRKIVAIFEIKPQAPVLEIKIELPWEELKVMLPLTLPVIPALSMHKPIYRQFTDSMTSNRFPATCSVSGRHLSTFDDVTMKIPHSACKVVLAHDCSSEKLFAVTLKSKSETSQKKVVTLYTPDRKISVHIPEYSSSQMKLEINDEDMTSSCSQEKPCIMRTTPTDENTPAIVKIVRSRSHIRIEDFAAGVTVKVSGKEYISVKVSPLFRGTLCGMCGNFNGDESDELTDSWRTPLESPSHLLASSAVRDETCTPSFIEKELDIEYAPNPRYNGKCRIVKETIKRRRHSKGEREVCFSTSPVEQCVPYKSCEPVKVKTVPIKFRCMKRSETNQSMKNVPTIIYEINVPSHCVAKPRK